MKVDKLYILCLENWYRNLGDIKPSAEGLTARNKKKVKDEAVTMLYLEGKHLPVSVNFEKPLGGDFKDVIEEIRGLATMNVGIYIVAHGTEIDDYRVGGMSAERLAQLIAEIKFPAVRKICIEACNMKPYYLSEFCKQLYTLSDPKLTPMVAGYRQFVTVVGSSATSGSNIYDVGGSEKQLIDAASEEMIGKKVIKADSTGIGTGIYKKSSLILLRSPSNPGTETQKKALSLSKFVMQCTDGSVKKLTLEEWHDS